jgi:hypothetical protein
VLLAGPYVVAALLLGIGGIAKVIRPGPAQRALTGMGLQLPTGLVRAGAAAEAGLAGAALATANRAVAAAVAVSFLVFTAFISAAIFRPGTVGDCGCFGSTESPPSILHLAINAACTMVATAAAATRVTTLYAELRARPGLGVAFVALTALATWLAYLCVSELVALHALVTSPRAVTSQRAPDHR